MRHPLLAPVPRHVEWRGAGLPVDRWQYEPVEGLPAALLETWQDLAAVDASPATDAEHANLRLRLDASLPGAQAYRLVVSDRGVDVSGGSAAGLFYGLMTLDQLLRQSPVELPGCCIDDSPDFSVRGVMLDVSRCKVPTLDTLFHLVDCLAGWKINQLQLYMEHTFAYPGHEVVWEDASPYSADDMRRLDDHCRRRFMELVPNQNSFGHLHRWLQHPAYRHLAEHDGTYATSWGETRSGPFSLDPTSPASLRFLEGLYDELLPCFSSRQANVGCDETFDLGCGKSRTRCEQVGKGRVYLEFLLKIHDALQARGCRMQFWGDIVLNHPDLVPDLPTDATPLVWGYEADHPFAEQCQRFADSGLDFYVCPGTSSWLSLAGRTDNCLRNLEQAAAAGRDSGASGYLITDWGDQGHWQYLPVSYAGFLAGASFSWCLQTNRTLPLAAALDVHAFGDQRGTMGRLALELGNIYQLVKPLKPNQSQLWRLLRRDADNVDEDGIVVSDLSAACAAIDAVAQQVHDVQLQRDDAALVQAEWAHACGFMLQGCARAIGRRQGVHDDPAHRRILSSDLRRLLDGHHELWMARNREGGYAESVAPLQALLDGDRAVHR